MTPFNKLITVTLPANKESAHVDTPLASIVPSGQQLVIEFVSSSATMPAGQKPIPAIGVVNSVGSAIVQHYPVMHGQVTYTTGETFTSADPMHFRLTPDLTLRIVLERNGKTGTAWLYMGISGYIDAL